MNEFKGTQSDWIEAGHNDNGIFISGGDSQDAIALVYYNNNTVKIGEGKANARLIANAPKLYNCLKRALRLLKMEGWTDADGGISYAQQIINDIEKEEI